MRKGVDLTSAPLLEALKLLGEFGVLTTSQLIRLIHGQHARGERTIKAMLTNMWRCNLVTRYAPTNNHEMAYTLDRSGVTVLRQAGYTPEGWRPCFRDALTYSRGYFTLEHNLLATEAMIRLLEAAKRQGLPRSYQHTPRHPAPPPHWDKLVRIDGFHIYIEADRASEKGQKIRHKIENYLRYIDEQHYPDFRVCVLFVVQMIDEPNSARRIESLKGMIERHCEREGWGSFAQFCRLVTLNAMRVEEVLSAPICRVSGCEGRHPLTRPVEFVQHAGMLLAPDALI